MNRRIPTPLQRYEALRSLLKDTPADHDFRGFFIGGPTMCTNWDLIAQYMAVSLILAWGDYMAALDAMEQREEAARVEALKAAGAKRLVQAMNGVRHRVRKHAA